MKPFDGPIFVINLTGSAGRLDSAQQQLNAAGLKSERIEAVDGRGRSAADFSSYDSKSAINFFGRDMTSGEVGCYLSHVKAAQSVMDSGAEYGLVFEDDFRAFPHTWPVMQHLTAFLKSEDCPEWDMVNLGRAPRSVMRPIQDITLDGVQRHTVFQAYYFPVIATAILWSKQGATRFVKEAANPIAPVDHMYRHLMSKSGKGLALSPAPFSILNVESDIAKASQSTKPKAKPNWWLKKKSEVKRQGASFKRAIFHKWIK